MSKELRPMFTNEQIKGAAATYNFAGVDSESKRLINEDLSKHCQTIVQQAQYSAKLDKRKGLQKKDADWAMKKNPGIPSGTY